MTVLIENDHLGPFEMILEVPEGTGTLGLLNVIKHTRRCN